MRTTVDNCARCGGKHVDLEFEKLLRFIVTDELVYEYWATCPNTHQPVLCAVIEHQSELVIDHAKTQEIG